MDKYKVLVSIFLLTFVYCISCDDIEEVKQRGLNEARQYFKYNHPPTPTETIPVAVVYDKVIDRGSRRRKVEPVGEIKPIARKSESETVMNVTVKSFVEKQITVKPVILGKSSTENNTTPKSRELKLEVRIPVSVVYDENPAIMKRNRIKSGVSTRLRNPNKALRKPNIKENDKSVTISGNDGRNKINEVHMKLDMLTQNNDKTNAANESKSENDFSNQSKLENTKVDSGSVVGKRRLNGDPDPIVPIVSSENHVFGHNGEFRYSYEGGDGTKAFSKGALKTYQEVAGEAVEGGFSYKDKDGNDFSLSYTADENGYRPVGAHLPTPPPIPPAIARALAYLATKPTPEPVTEAIDQENIPPLQANSFLKQ